MSSLQPSFTLDELLAYLAEAEEPLEGYKTSQEWQDTLGLTDKRMIKLLRVAHKQGKLLTTKQRRPTIDGRMSLVPVYAFKLEQRG